MQFLITGGAGFLGAALANRLTADGHAVRVIDDLSAGDRARLDNKVHFTRGDVNDIPLLWSMLEDVDCVYHLAARVSVAQSLLYPRDYNQVNVGGTVSLMEAMRDAGVRRVVFASSGAVYGRQTIQPVRETMTPNPDSPYAVSKWAAEQYIHTIGALWDIETVALRIFNAYGPEQSLPASNAPLIPQFMQQLLTGGSLVVYGDGRQTRDFIYLDDVIMAMTRAANARNVNRRVINIGSGVETAVADIVELLAEATGLRPHVIYNRQKESGVHRLAADPRLARELLDFRPRVLLAEGLSLTLREDGRFRRAQFAADRLPALA
jgi:UDP-glucose 4-epimerase